MFKHIILFCNLAIEAALCLVEALIFGVIFFPVFRVVENSANRLGVEEQTSSTSTVSIVSDHPHLQVENHPYQVEELSVQRIEL